ncbi:MAG: SUMF1/EgtB/PvdO family nonheme iron enzyme [Cyanobacteria bacterium J06600_6]
MNKYQQDRLRLGLSIAIAFNIASCQISQPADSSNLNRQECEADSAFAFVSGGEFTQGSDRQERDFAYRISAQAISATAGGVKQAEVQLRQVGWFEQESDRQTVFLPDYCISRNLVTNQEYQEFVQATNRQTPGITLEEYQQQGFLVHPYSKVQEFLWHNETYPPNTAKHPAVLISYQDAVAYAKWKGIQTGAKYRLPSELEWEKAARGASANYFPWGNDWRSPATNFAGSRINYTTKIAAYPLSKSVYGVEDMAGNVFEYTSTLKQQDRRTVMKGCSWDDLPGFCRAAYRHTRPINSRHILFGFRLVKTK